MKACSKCNKNTNSNYLARQYGVLCGNCAKEHGNNAIDQLNKEINELRANIIVINYDIKEAIYSDCKHEFLDTGYCQVINGSAKTIYCCSVCGLEKVNQNVVLIER